MTRWEYRIDLPPNTVTELRAYQAAGGLPGALTTAGAEGWELVTVTSNQTLIYKRPIAQH
ncbi:hypothetical protein ACTMTI_43835 [Nonomuraea sp. H19]|uniref:hypothetical protein n=1 Tax=Nonomuraea sp. H19 TaxID=3452206 RepID=UPI003F8860D2